MNSYKTVVVAVGGNSLISSGQEGNLEEQYINAYLTCKHVVKLIKSGFRVVLTHGNGPQVGNILLRVENTRDITYDIALDYCGAMSQGELGYLISNALDECLEEENIEIPVATIVTRTLVDGDDPAFQNPAKPIGKFYTEKEAMEMSDKYGFVMKEDSGRGYRHVVASPEPVEILEYKSIKSLIDASNLVIACGGGGVPVIRKNKKITGVQAVIDKDMTSSLLASRINADLLVISTAVSNVYINFGKENQQALGEIKADEVRQYLNNDEFRAGSMKPKIIAALKFLEKGGKRAIITSPDKIELAVSNSEIGTQIIA